MAQHPIDPIQGGTGVSNNNASTLTISGSYPLTITLSGATNVTFPTSGTLITSSTTVTASQLPAFSGDASSSAGTSVLTLATVNSNVGSFGDAAHTVSLTVNGKGLITAVSSNSIAISGSAITSGTVSGVRLPAFVANGDATGTFDQTNPGTLALTLATVNSNVGSFGDASHSVSVTVNGKGLVTAASSNAIALAGSAITTGTISGARLPAFTHSGDATGTFDQTNPGNVPLTLATVNSNVGSFGDASHVGTFTVNGKGLVTAASSTAIAIASGAVSGLAASATTDTTNASNITSGTLPNGRLTGVYSGITGLGAQSQALNMNSNLINNVSTPVSSGDAANKAYVDALGSGITWKNSVKASTTANLSGTYVGSPTFTLTNNSTQAAFAVDGYSASIGDRILVKNQTTQSQNGIYSVTVVGSGSTNWVLTRTSDFNEVTPIDEINGAAVYVQQGTLNANTGWTQIDHVVTFDSDPIAWAQFSGTGSGVSSLTAGTGISVSSPTGAVTVSNTGVISFNSRTGAVSPTSGDYSFSLISGSVAASQMPALTGDITTSAGTVATTLATVNSNVGSFGSASSVATFTVNGKGLITAAGSTSIALAGSAITSGTITGTRLPAFTASGDATGTFDQTNPGNIPLTLATVNGNVGSFTNANITVNAKGLITAAANGSSGAPGGSTTQVQFNLSGAFAGDPGFTYVGSTTQTLTLGTASTGPTILATAGTTNGTVFAITGSAATSGNGGNVNITSGAGTGSNTGGTVAIAGAAGTSNVAGGPVTITGGTSVGATGSNVTITGGANNAAGNAAGNVLIIGGTNSAASSFAGNVTIKGGLIGSGTGNTGFGIIDLQTGVTALTSRLTIDRLGAWLVGGSAGSSTNVLTSNGAGTPPTWQATVGTATNIAGGAANEIPFQSAASTTAFSTSFTWTNSTKLLTLGDGATGPSIIATGNAGSTVPSFTIQGGAATGTTESGGHLILNGGTVSTTGNTAGQVQINGGAGIGSGASGGRVVITGGVGDGTSVRGGTVVITGGTGATGPVQGEAVNITGGANIGAAAGGAVNIASGTGASGTGGTITLSTGTTASVTRLTLGSGGDWSVGGGVGTSGQVFISGGSGATPTWSSSPTITGANITGIPNGALTNSSVTIGSTSIALGATSTTLAGLTGVTLSSGTLTLTAATANSFIYSGTAGAISNTAQATNGSLLIGSTGAAPVLATLTGTANQITVTNGAGSITLSLPTTLNLGTAATGPTINATTGTTNGTTFALNGSAPGSATGNGGSITINAASGGATSGTGGNITIGTGSAPGSGAASSGTIAIYAGPQQAIGITSLGQTQIFQPSAGGVALVVTGQSLINAQDNVTAVSAAGVTTTINCQNGNVEKITLGAGANTITFSNTPGTNTSQTMTILLVQDGTGSRVLPTFSQLATANWDNGVVPVLTTTAGQMDIIQVLIVNVAGTTKYYGAQVMGNVTP